MQLIQRDQYVWAHDIRFIRNQGKLLSVNKTTKLEAAQVMAIYSDAVQNMMLKQSQQQYSESPRLAQEKYEQLL